jgi:hypothetical protein
MTDIPRYLVSLNAMTAWRDNAMVTDQIGMVTYADHVEALRQARNEPQDGDDFWPSRVRHAEKRGYEQGQRDALNAAVQRVEALGWDYTYRSRGTILEYVNRARTIAAIKGDQE